MIATGLVLFLLAIQLIRPQRNDGIPGGPKDITKMVQVPDSVMVALKKSCYDCHSNYTVYPWYDQITPVNWWLTSHVNDGKKRLNFNSFGAMPQGKMDKKLKEIAETVKKDEMPLDSYLWLHHDAKLTTTQKQLIIDWTTSARAELLKKPID